MGRDRSKSIETEEEDANSMDPNDGVLSVSKQKKKHLFQKRWKKFGGSNEWKNACGVPDDADNGEELGITSGPPILTISVDESKAIDLNERVQTKSDEQISREFALAARDSVKQQMDALEPDGEASEQDWNPPNGATSTGTDGGFTGLTSGTGSSQFDKSARSLPPESMQPTPTLDTFGAAKIQQIIIPKSAEPELGEKIQARDLVSLHSGPNGCLVFVIRRPGCLLCREQALYLKFLFENYPQEVEGFEIVGVVKEFCEKGGQKLREFHDKYFPFPLYLDIDKAAYKALGNRKAGLGSALKVLNPFSDVSKRIKKNQISGDITGEGFVQGGIIIYHRHGVAAYKYEEETGLELPVADIVRGLRVVRRDDFVPPLPSVKQAPESHRHGKDFDISVRTVE